MNSEVSVGAAIGLGLTVGLIYLIYRAFKGVFGGHGSVAPLGSMICPTCGTRGEPALHTKGSIGMEILLWILFIIPGLIYSLWRVSSRVPVCPACKAPGMIQANSPRGQQLARQFAPPA